MLASYPTVLCLSSDIIREKRIFPAHRIREMYARFPIQSTDKPARITSTFIQ